MISFTRLLTAATKFGEITANNCHAYLQRILKNARTDRAHEFLVDFTLEAIDVDAHDVRRGERMVLHQDLTSTP